MAQLNNLLTDGNVDLEKIFYDFEDDFKQIFFSEETGKLLERLDILKSEDFHPSIVENKYYVNNPKIRILTFAVLRELLNGKNENITSKLIKILRKSSISSENKENSENIAEKLTLEENSTD